jgi:hypothetical protein
VVLLVLFSEEFDEVSLLNYEEGTGQRCLCKKGRERHYVLTIRFEKNIWRIAIKMRAEMGFPRTICSVSSVSVRDGREDGK